MRFVFLLLMVICLVSHANSISISGEDGRKNFVVSKHSPLNTRALSDGELNEAIEELLKNHDDSEQLPTSHLSANQFFVNSDTLNVRDAPNGNIVDKLIRGQEVGVYESSDDKKWFRISHNQSQWVWSASLCEGESCYVKNDFGRTEYLTTYTPPESKTKTKKSGKKSKGSASDANFESSYGGSSCPCSSSYNCTGPRGGKYCYTSGGNKRYR